jgi:hypothetical protein
VAQVEASVCRDAAATVQEEPSAAADLDWSFGDWSDFEIELARWTFSVHPDEEGAALLFVRNRSI